MIIWPQEMSSKLNHNYKEPFSKSNFQMGSRENSPPHGGMMDTAMRSNSAARPMDSSFGTATSAQELQGHGAQQGQQQVQIMLLCSKYCNSLYIA